MNRENNFDKAYKYTNRNEGHGWSKHPDDRGGLTYAGISEKQNKDWEGWSTIKAIMSEEREPNLQEQQLLNHLHRNFFLDKYWRGIKGDYLAQALAIQVYDAAVNVGIWQASLFLQIALNKANRNDHYYGDVVEDGVIGAQTTAACEAAEQNGLQQLLMHLFTTQLSYFYMQIMENDPSQEVFCKGWILRAFRAIQDARII